MTYQEYYGGSLVTTPTEAQASALGLKRKRKRSNLSNFDRGPRYYQPTLSMGSPTLPLATDHVSRAQAEEILSQRIAPHFGPTSKRPIVASPELLGNLGAELTNDLSMGKRK